jgi:hypothetical protein
MHHGSPCVIKLVCCFKFRGDASRMLQVCLQTRAVTHLLRFSCNTLRQPTEHTELVHILHHIYWYAAGFASNMTLLILHFIGDTVMKRSNFYLHCMDFTDKLSLRLGTSVEIIRQTASPTENSRLSAYHLSECPR